MKNIKIHWIYEGERGFYRSVEGRFQIEGEGYRHGQTPDGYSLWDNTRQIGDGFVFTFEKVGECKAKALAIVINELKRDALIEG